MPLEPHTAIEMLAMPGVCNGGEIHSKGGLGMTNPLNESTEDDLVAAMNKHEAYEWKALMVIQWDQTKITKLLESLAKGEGKYLDAFCLIEWRPDPAGAKLWMIRKKGYPKT